MEFENRRKQEKQKTMSGTVNRIKRGQGRKDKRGSYKRR